VTQRVRGIALLFQDLGARRGGLNIQQHAPAALNPRDRPGTHCTEGWVGPRAGLDGRKILPPPGIRSPNLPARSQSLYRLSYPAHCNYNNHYELKKCTQIQITRRLKYKFKFKIIDYIFNIRNKCVLYIKYLYVLYLNV
jgi:hypothetical protein